MSADLESSRQFWNQKAQENPFWYVSSYGSYSERDSDEFWKSGFQIWREIKSTVGYLPAEGDAVVEIGCGVGRLTQAIIEDVSRCTAFDISENMLGIAKAKVGNRVEFRHTTGTTLPSVPDQSSDLTLAYCVFQHLPSESDLRSYLCEMARVTKPGGIVAFTTSPRSWRALMLPAARVRAFLRTRGARNGPQGIHKKEWVGIRPSVARVRRLCSINLQSTRFGEERILFWGRR